MCVCVLLFKGNIISPTDNIMLNSFTCKIKMRLYYIIFVIFLLFWLLIHFPSSFLKTHQESSEVVCVCMCNVIHSKDGKLLFIHVQQIKSKSILLHGERPRHTQPYIDPGDNKKENLCHPKCFRVFNIRKLKNSFFLGQF